MKIKIRHNCSDFDSYRAARCKSLFNVESGCNFSLDADLPIDDDQWSIGLVVGPSGSGKTSIGKEIFGLDCFYNFDNWPKDKPIIDAINSDGDFDEVTRALAGVGLGSVPSWLRPFPVLSNGEKFRANLARVICEAPERIVIDEFTSVVDRQIAKVGAHAFSKNWKRAQKDGVKKCVLLSCHYDIIDWLEPDWVYDIATGKYQGRGLWRRPEIELKIFQTNWRFWGLFREHHYLKVDKMPAAKVYLGVVDGEPVAHYAVAPKPKGKTVEARGARFVVNPQWQGCGIGVRFVNFIAQLQLDGKGVLPGRKLTLLATTSHPGLARARRNDPKWQQVTCPLHGQNKAYAANTHKRQGKKSGFGGFGGHFRAVQGFRYIGENPTEDIITRKFRGGRVGKSKAVRDKAKK
ncbi:MAG: ABC transporter ATP-binding protein [Patescibacteria group bacterium]